MSAKDPALLVRVAPELVTKGPATRHRLHQLLAARVRESLLRRGISHEQSYSHGRLIVRCQGIEAATRALAETFGVGSISPVELETTAELASILRLGSEHFAPLVRGRSYAVRVKRFGRHEYRASELERALGARLIEAARVDLERPDITVGVEVLGDRAFLFQRRSAGPGGLPGASEGRALSLTSGGFDSPVAAWRIMKRGVAVDHLLCNLGGPAYSGIVLDVVRALAARWCHGHRPSLHVLDFGAVVARMREEVGSGYWQVALKRLMLDAAECVALEIGADALITGESIAQVSSQTLKNLRAIDARAARLPVLRPLVGMDKREIIDEARRIGTAPLSERVREYCALGAPRPVVSAKESRLREAMSRIGAELVKDAVAGRTVLSVLDASTPESRFARVFVREIPDRAVLVDCRPAHELGRGHPFEGAIHREAGELIEGVRELDKARTYLPVCSHGGQAGSLASELQRAGYEAYAFEGGARALERHLATRAP